MCLRDRWDDFKKHMAAMQELRDGGSVAMLGAVNDLYELLTFNAVSYTHLKGKQSELNNSISAAKLSAAEAQAAQQKLSLIHI